MTIFYSTKAEKKEEENEWKSWELKKFQEFRFEIDFTSSIVIKV